MYEKTNRCIFRNLTYKKFVSLYILVILIFAVFAGTMITVIADPNSPAVVYFENPASGSTNVSVGLSELSVNISDPEGDIFSWSITTSPDIGGNSSAGAFNGTFTCPVPGINNDTFYTWNVSVIDLGSGIWTNESFNFTTESVGGDPPEGNGTGTLMGFVNDSHGDPLPDARVIINRTDEGGHPHEAVLTNLSGLYIFNHNLSQGTYDIEVLKDECEPAFEFGVNVSENETSWKNITMGFSEGPGGEGQIDFDGWRSSLDQTYIMNGTTESFNFTIYSHGLTEGTVDNLTITLPKDFLYKGNNGTTISDDDYFVYNTTNSIVWQNDTGEGFHLDEIENFWFDANSSASLGSSDFVITVFVDGEPYEQPLTFTVFTTTSFYHTGSIVDADGQPLEGAKANISAQSFGMEGIVNLGYFSAAANATGHYNITDIPTTVENANDENFSGMMGPGGMGEDQIFYQLSAADYHPTYTNLATHVSASLPYVTVLEFISMIGEPEIYLRPAVSFRVNVTGPIYNWTGEEMEVIQGPKNFSLMVKDQILGFQVREFSTMALERTFSVPQGRDYSFTIFADTSFPISMKFEDIIETCAGSQDFGLDGVTTQVMQYGETYLVNVSVDVSSTSRWVNGTFNNVTDPSEMRVVAYNMEWQGEETMVFENWAMPYNLDDEFRNGEYDRYNLTTKEFNISLPATSAESMLLLRAYARNESGYFMGSTKINASNQNFSDSFIEFDMEKLIDGPYSANRTVTSSNVSDNWNETTVVETIGVLFNLVNETGSLLETENPFVEMKRELDGEIYNQMIDGSSGQFNVSLVEGEGLYKLTIYSQQYAPISTSVSADVISGANSTDTITCSDGQCNITMRSFGDYDPLGKNASIMMMMYKSNETCNVPNPPDYCSLCGGGEDDEPLGEDGDGKDGMSKDEFSPFAAILMGDISMMIMSNSSSGWIYVYYLTVDLLASGPPDAAFSTEAEDAQDGLAKAWQFGSQGPDIYEEVLIGIPLDDELINKTVKVTIPLLYDNDFETVLWNESAGDTIDTIRNNPTLNISYGDYLGEPYEAYLNGTGVICNESDPTLSSGLGYKDVENSTIWIKIPHFSTVETQITGEEPDPPSSFTATSEEETEISLSWTNAAKADSTYVERNDTNQTVWAKGSGIFLYNGSNQSYNDINLSEETTYYYQAWSYNATNNYWSITNASLSKETGSDIDDGSPGGSTPPPSSSGDDDDTNGTDNETETPEITGNDTELPPVSQYASNGTRDAINEEYGLDLNESFYANDTDGDGRVDSFTDPSEELIAIHATEIGDNTSFLISTDGDEIPEFFWDAESDEITPITHSQGSVESEENNTEEQKITVTIKIDKADWVYIEIDDTYPDYDLTVKTSDGRVIDSDKIWREGGKIYVLDDPDVEYDFEYDYSGYIQLPAGDDSQSDDTTSTAVPWYAWIIIVVFAILIIIGLMFKTGFLYIEDNNKKS